MAQGKVTKVHFPSSKTKNSIIPASFWHPFLPLPNHHHSKSLGTVRAHPHTTCAPTSPAPNPARICPEAFGSCGWERLQYQRAEIWVIFGTLSFNKQPQSAFKTQALTILKTRKLKLSWDRGEKELSPPSPTLPKGHTANQKPSEKVWPSMTITPGGTGENLRTGTSPARGKTKIWLVIFGVGVEEKHAHSWILPRGAGLEVEMGRGGGNGETVFFTVAKRRKEGKWEKELWAAALYFSEGHKAAKPRELNGLGSKMKVGKKMGQWKEIYTPTTNLGRSGDMGETLPDSREQ